MKMKIKIADEFIEIDIDDLAHQASRQWLDIFRALAPSLRPAIDVLSRNSVTHVHCPIHGGVNGDAFRLYRDSNETGGGVCNTCGAHRGGISMLRWVNGWNTREVVSELYQYLNGSLVIRKPVRFGVSKPVTPARKKKPMSKSVFDDLWYSSVPLSHPSAILAQNYLRSRKVFCEGIQDIRYNPNCYYKGPDNQVSHHPAMISLIRDAKGRPVTLHRTYLQANATKADIHNAKSILPIAEGLSKDARMSNVAIRLSAPAPTLGIAEGIETALACYKATGIPTWSVINDGLMKSFDPPIGVRHLVIFADKDRSVKKEGTERGKAGQKAAFALSAKLSQTGIKVTVAIPEQPIPVGAKGIDWADVYAAHGPAGFSHSRKSA